MYTDIIGTQQILITAAFLGVMILLLVILRKKSTVIRASMKAGKRMSIIEDTAVSPTERLRLLSVDSALFIMVSAKGHAPSLVSLNTAEARSVRRQISGTDVVDESDDVNVPDTDATKVHTTTKPYEKSSSNHFSGVTQSEEVNQNDEQKAFAEKFRSWRQHNEAR